MSGLDEQHLEMELGKFVEGVRVVQMANREFYAVIPALNSMPEHAIRAFARLQYLGTTYEDARKYILHRWGPQRA